ncbi:hypothetical protein [Methylocaldum sp.]|uniref:hypothetical protein n=1 Tax=Methylocaldum sp. TaxID=1969727 RepID=UPI002D2224D4|nr:hypothetical protein [Methylocaldum sp.]HYE35499.1 hypothetical protein [Methylocaldum sp.]
MSDATNTPNESEKPVELTKAQAAALVFREVPELGDDGKPTGKVAQKRVTADEVFAFSDYGTHVVVVTVDGRKLRGDKPKPALSKVEGAEAKKAGK